MPGRLFLFLSILTASGISPAPIALMNSGISTLTGQPSMQPGFLHTMQRLASSRACSSVYPRATSLKFLFLTSGACFGMGTRFRFSFDFSAIFTLQRLARVIWIILQADAGYQVATGQMPVPLLLDKLV